MIIVDQFTKIIRLRTTTTTAVLLKEIAKIYKDYIWKIHRVLKEMNIIYSILSCSTISIISKIIGQNSYQQQNSSITTRNT